MGSLLPHNSLLTRPFRRTSSPTLSPRPRQAYNARRFALPLLCLIVLAVYEWRLRTVESSLKDALANKHIYHISSEPSGPVESRNSTLKHLRRRYERKRRKKEFNARLNATEMAEGSSRFVLPPERVDIVERLLCGTGGQISPGLLNWTMVEEGDLMEEVGRYWPRWWSSADEAGSPWDYAPVEREGEARLLFLTGGICLVSL